MIHIYFVNLLILSVSIFYMKNKIFLSYYFTLNRIYIIDKYFILIYYFFKIRINFVSLFSKYIKMDKFFLIFIFSKKKLFSKLKSKFN